jgi:hypothetical protein
MDVNTLFKVVEVDIVGSTGVFKVGYVVGLHILQFGIKKG